MKELFRKAVKSRKFMLTLAGIIGVILNRGLGLGIDETMIDNTVLLIIAYVIGESGVDGLGALGSVINRIFGKDNDRTDD